MLQIPKGPFLLSSASGWFVSPLSQRSSLDHNIFPGVRGPGGSAVLPTPSPAPWATPNLKGSCRLHGPDPATQSTSSKARGHSKARKGNFLTHSGEIFLASNRQALRKATLQYTPGTKRSPRPNPTRDKLPAATTSKRGEGRAIWWLHQRAGSRQS